MFEILQAPRVGFADRHGNSEWLVGWVEPFARPNITAVQLRVGSRNTIKLAQIA
jgi:hypothetical protein